MGGSLQTKKGQSNGGIDPEKWERSPAEAVGQVSNSTLASMTGGDANTFEGIVDYILMGEEQDAPDESQIAAAEEVGLLERDYPAEVETEASMVNSPALSGAGMTGAGMPSLSGDAGSVDIEGVGGGGALGSLEAGAAESLSIESIGTAPRFGKAGAPRGGGGSGGQVVAHTGDDMKVYEALGGVDPAQLSGQNAGALAAMDGMVQGLAGQMGSAVSSAVGSLNGTYAGSVGSLDASLDANLSLITGSFSGARAQVDQAAERTLEQIQSSSARAIQEIDVSSADLLADAETLVANTASTLVSQASSTESAALGQVSAAQSRASAVAQQWAQTAAATGTREAAAYRGRGNGGTEGKRDEARAQVAESYGAGYAEDIPVKGQEVVQLLEQEKANISSAIQELIRPMIEQDLPELLRNLRADVETAATSARDSVEEGREQSVESVHEHHAETGRELAAAESTSITDLLSLHGTASQGLDTAHEASVEEISAMGEGLKFHLAEKSAQMASLIAKNPMMPSEALQTDISNLSAELMSEAMGGQAAIQAMAQERAANEMELTANAVESMGQIGQQGALGAQQIAGEAVGSLDEMGAGFEAGIDEMLAGFQSNIDSLRDQLNANVNTVLQSALSGLSQTLDGVRTGVNDFVDGFDADMNEAVNVTMMNDMRAKAEEEAAKIKEPSFWDKVCSIVKIVLIVVVIVAITVVTAGVGTMVAGAIAGAVAAGTLSTLAGAALTIVAAAAIGAVSSALQEIVMQIATVGFDPRNWDWKKIGTEALWGGITSGLTAGLGVAVQSIGKWARTAQSASNATRAPAVTRAINYASTWVDDAGKLTKAGETARDVADEIVGHAVEWVKTGEAPDLVQIASDKAVESVTGVFIEGMADRLKLPEESARRDSFTTFMEDMRDEVKDGDIKAALEEANASVGDLGQLDLTMDYKPTWSPTW